MAIKKCKGIKIEEEGDLKDQKLLQRSQKLIHRDKMKLGCIKSPP